MVSEVSDLVGLVRELFMVGAPGKGSGLLYGS